MRHIPFQKRWKRRMRKMRDKTAQKFLDTRYGRKLIIEWISPRVVSMTIDAGDHLMTFSPHEFIGQRIYRKNQFERDGVTLLLSTLKEHNIDLSGVLLEIGGNIGTQSIYFALTPEFSRILSVEADPRNFKLLEHNIRQNGMDGRITAIACAAGESSGTIDFFQHTDNHGKSSAIRQSPKDRQITVPVLPVSDILKEAGVATAEVSLIFMDIEGYEPVAARSMVPLLQRQTPFYLEFTKDFYGLDGATDFARWLGTFYTRCIVFHKGSVVQMALADMPIPDYQFDLLLLPDA